MYGSRWGRKSCDQLVRLMRHNRTRVALPATNQTELSTQQIFVYRYSDFLAPLLTPQMGYVEEGTLTTWYEETAENLERLIEGKELLHRII